MSCLQGYTPFRTLPFLAKLRTVYLCDCMALSIIGERLKMHQEFRLQRELSTFESIPDVRESKARRRAKGAGGRASDALLPHSHTLSHEVNSRLSKAILNIPLTDLRTYCSVMECAYSGHQFFGQVRAKAKPQARACC